MVGVGGGGLGVGPLGRPVALTLALSRRVGEGMADKRTLGGGDRAM